MLPVVKAVVVQWICLSDEELVDEGEDREQLQLLQNERKGERVR